LAMVESDLIAVRIPSDNRQPMLRICLALLAAEINLIQAYPLLINSEEFSAVALMVDDIEMAQQTISEQGFHMLTEQELIDLHEGL